MNKENKNFYQLSQYYDVVHKNKNYIEEVNYIDRLLKKYSPNNKSILEFGSGTGGHARYFVKKKYTVFGIEKCKDMIKNCKEIKGFTVQYGDLCKKKLKKKFDFVLSLFHVFSYQTEIAQINNFFENANFHLKAKGLLGFDFWYYPAVIYQKPRIKLIELKKKNYRLFKLAEPFINKKKKTVDVKYTIAIENLSSKKVEVINENHLMRYFSLSELNTFFVKYKFKLLHARELITNKEPGKNTWGVFCLLQKY
jgi:SAM-dependent methyltransferase